ncbi:MAG: RNA polymerase sigma factor [Eubacterium sp.]
MSKAFADRQLEKAYDEYGYAVEKYCRFRLGEAQDFSADCMQEAFCVYYKRLLNGERFENPRAFLYKTANNMVLRAREEYFKNAKYTKSLNDAENEAAYSDYDDDLEIDVNYIKEVLFSKLNENEKQLYTMKYAQEMSLKEISEILNIPPAAVASRTSRLRTKIKKIAKPLLSKGQKGGN